MSKNYPIILGYCYIVCQFTGVVLADGDEYIQCKDPTAKYGKYFDGRSLAMCGGTTKGYHLEAIYHLCETTYMYETGVPYTNLIKGKNVKEACESGDELPTNVVVAYFEKRELNYMPPETNRHTAIFLRCEGNTAIRVADQKCRTKFNERTVELKVITGVNDPEIVSGEKYYFATIDPKWVKKQTRQHVLKEEAEARAKEEQETKQTANERKRAAKEEKRVEKEAKSASTKKKTGFFGFIGRLKTMFTSRKKSESPS